MGLILKRYAVFLSTLCLVLATSGCALSKKIDHIKLKRQQRAEALLSFEKQFKSYRTIGMVEADVFVSELLAGGELEPNPEWSSDVKKHLTPLVVQEFSKKGVAVKPVGFDKETAGDLHDAYCMYQAVNENFRDVNDDYKKLPLCNEDFPCFDYTIGPIEGFLKKEKVDLLLFVFAVNEIETEARREARKSSHVSAAFSHMFGTGGIKPLRKPGALVGMTLIDKSGEVVWHAHEEEDVVDLRTPQVTEKLAKEVIEELFERD
jgi:hypothetical protein